MTNTYDNHDFCFLARIVLEAETPLKIGSGRDNIKTDAVINRDVNGLPYIPATTLQGLMRHAIYETNEEGKTDKTTAERIMGFQTKREGHGSWLSVTEAKLVIDGKDDVVDGLLDPDEVAKDSYLKVFRQMPIRQHVRIGHKGTAEKAGKFDEEIIPQGVRFCFEMELRADEATGKGDFDKLLAAIQSETFRIGGGSRKGFGKVKVLHIGYRELNLTKSEDFEAYVNKTSSLATPWNGFEDMTPKFIKKEGKDIIHYTHYTLELQPVDFIFFSSGLGDPETSVDKTIVKEPFVTWEDGKPRWAESKKSLVIPASSVKGAISHRVAFYYNQLTGVKAEDLHTEDERKAHVGKNNEAVKALFGSEGNERGEDKRRGHVLFSDVIREQKSSIEKTLNHVKIDRFTGGAIEGALFDEESLYAHNEKIKLEVTVLRDKDCSDAVIKALDNALQDICLGTLPLGGGVNRGNGCFTGELYKNGKKQ